MSASKDFIKIMTGFIRIVTRPEVLKQEGVGPVSRWFALDRGTPIDRYYIEKFLLENSKYIRGRVLEVGDSTYTSRFGTDVVARDVLHVSNDHPGATITGDLSQHHTLPADAFDCFICTQTFNFIYQVKEAITGAHRLLVPGGILMATVAGISQVSRSDMMAWGDYWRFTTLSAQKSFEDVFGKGNVRVNYYGNCLAATSFLRGIACEEIPAEKLDIKDAEYPVTITILARKNDQDL